MTVLTDLTLVEARDGLAKGDFTAVELTEAHIRAMEASRALGAYITETPEQALEQARQSDARRATGTVGLMEGLPVALKDLFCTKGVRTTAASRMLENFVPPYDSTVGRNLARAGAVTLGKTNLDEFAMGSSNRTSFFGPAVNPWKRTGDDAALAPGGSSGGSAAAVAGRIALAATGTDTGGSIRQPAAFCGIVGLKPTYGRCSRRGIIAFASSLDQAGPMTRSVKDAALMLSAMAGHDPLDSTSAPVEVPNFENALTGDIRGLRVGVPREYRADGLDPEVSALWDRGVEMLRDAGAEVVEVSLPHTDHALATYYILSSAEASSNLARYDGVRYGLRVEGKTLDEMYSRTRGAGFGPEVQRRILIGTYALSAGFYDAYYLKAQRVRRLITRDFLEAFGSVDVLLTPTTPTPAFALDEEPTDPLTLYLNDVFTVPTSLAGLPALSMPAGLSGQGLPLGLQLVGRHFQEETLLNAALVLERACAFSGAPMFAGKEV
ncbi:Asp-tRNA(Asn)/Glu-tRNA(Gln) amidotransferase subunit GatA [Phaeovibrio sulfidiphilus]|uniref:Glutamyl-tRNA(Gln) amidotransferase subunit A n=1 Tax=Phaeovibrio sulfidiphilus TaxID=1220600 RepID=A0A8J7CQA9_9PROT|nr:Asp-tRNA(Asn)/Glu-tRNA(Gln) amidotransferase subunit GatA [Phaeovibrio sulfidiphilus]